MMTPPNQALQRHDAPLPIGASCGLRLPHMRDWVVRRPHTRTEDDTFLLCRFPASLHLGAFAFSSGFASTQRRQAAKAQGEFFRSGAGVGCGGAHIAERNSCR